MRSAPRSGSAAAGRLGGTLALALVAVTAAAAADLGAASRAFVAGDCAKARALLMEPATKGDPDAQYLVGWLHGQAWCEGSVPASGPEWMRRAAERGHAEALYALALLELGWPLPHEVRLGDLRWPPQRPDAACLDDLRNEGEWWPPRATDLAATPWLGKAAEAGHPQALAMRARLAIGSDRPRGVALAERSAALGSDEGRALLAELVIDERPDVAGRALLELERSLDAREWTLFATAVDSGSPAAIEALLDAVQERGERGRYREMFHALSILAHRDVAPAMNDLGLMYASELGTPRDAAQSLLWLSLADKRKGVSNSGQEVFERLSAELSVEARKAVVQRLAHWSPSRWLPDLVSDEGPPWADRDGIARPTKESGDPASLPETAREERVEGCVLLVTTIDTTGRPTATHVVRSSGAGHGFERAALDAVAGWRFRPATRAGTPLDARMTLLVPFTLDDPLRAPAPEPP